jgi:hypothetical protein
MGIEPTSEAWEASILPLYDARSSRRPDYTATFLRRVYSGTVSHFTRSIPFSYLFRPLPAALPRNFGIDCASRRVRLH